jgi:hypothetical protein
MMPSWTSAWVTLLVISPQHWIASLLVITIYLNQSIKNRLVLENDDVCWSVHDLLLVCKEHDIPFVLDFHHHDIVFNSSQLREGTKGNMGSKRHHTEDAL